VIQRLSIRANLHSRPFPSVLHFPDCTKSSFFKVRRFQGKEDLEQQLCEWHQEVNDERRCRPTGVIPAVHLVKERVQLHPLKVRPQELAMWIPVYVGRTGTVLRGGHPYSMPPGSAADLSPQALRHPLLLDIGAGESRERESQTMRKFTGEGLYRNDDAGGKECGTPATRLLLQAGQTRQGESFAPLAHDLSGCVSACGNDVVRQSRAAKRTILARMTSRYGDVYFRLVFPVSGTLRK